VPPAVSRPAATRAPGSGSPEASVMQPRRRPVGRPCASAKAWIAFEPLPSPTENQRVNELAPPAGTEKLGGIAAPSTAGTACPCSTNDTPDCVKVLEGSGTSGGRALTSA
jgi:hypothetical protein